MSKDDVTGDRDADDCEACDEDASFHCDLCGEDSCGEHAQGHVCPETGIAKVAVTKLVAEWEALKLLQQGMKGTLVATLHDSYAAGLARGRALGARDEREARADVWRQLDEIAKGSVEVQRLLEARRAGRGT